MFTHPNILNDIEDLTDELARSLKEEGIESIINAFNLGHETFISFASLEDHVLSVLSKNYSSSLPETAVNFLNRGIANIHGAVATLKYTKDAQSVAFPSQQAVEMFLKAYIAQSKPELNEAGFKKYGHVLKSILQKIIEDEQTAEFQDIKSSVQKVDMNINHRYKPIAYPDQKAIETIDSMLKSCHFISEKILSKVTVNI